MCIRDRPDHLALNDLEVSNKINTFINPDELFLTTLKNSEHNLYKNFLFRV